MVLKACIFSLLWTGFISAQAEMNYSYEMKYGVGKQVTPASQDTTDYSYFENILDINTYFGENLYLYTQLEYSNPPVLGYSRTRIDSILNTFYIEYAHDRFNITLGDLYELYGRGLALYTFQDQIIDYNNSIKGLVFEYFLNEKINFSTLIGNGDYSYRFNTASITSDRSFINNVITGSINYENEVLGYFQYLYLNQQSVFKPDMVEEIQREDTELGNDLEERKNLGLVDSMDKDVVNHTHNINWNYFSGAFDIYIDKSWINYNKIYGEDVFGSRFYTSIYTELLETGITYEYKNYYTPYLIKSISNPPIVYREGSSILASRNVHSMNFGNEIGHQIELNKNLFNRLSVVGNLSLSHRNQKEDMADLDIVDYFIMEEESSIYEYYPFRQMYLEMNGWALSDRFFYKIGMDHFAEFIGGKNSFALTIPTQWVWKLSNGSSFTIYLEIQEQTVNKLSSIDPPDVDQYINHYLSVSYSHVGRWIVTGFYDYENYTKKMMRDPDYVLFNELTTVSSTANHWSGLDCTFFFTSETQISFFYGSQKGGLVCANGICAEQPGFEDGYKITLRSLF